MRDTKKFAVYNSKGKVGTFSVPVQRLRIMDKHVWSQFMKNYPNLGNKPREYSIYFQWIII